VFMMLLVLLLLLRSLAVTSVMAEVFQMNKRG
jgi:hypothetical protein